MENYAGSISNKIGEKLNYDDEKKAVISYGLAALFQVVSIFFIISVIGILADFWIEAVVIFIAVGLFRRSAGGAHSETFFGCMIISVLSIILLAFFARYVLVFNNIDVIWAAVVLFICYDISFFCVYRLAPVASKNKPINKPEKIKRLRRGSLVTFFIYLLCSLLLLLLSNYQFRFVSISLSLCFATLWQAFTLTRPGHLFLETIDKKFRYC